jgi:hypothetical protein
MLLLGIGFEAKLTTAPAATASAPRADRASIAMDDRRSVASVDRPR